MICSVAFAESTTIDFTTKTVTTVTGDGDQEKIGDGFALTSDGYTFTAVKNKGTSAPTQNASAKDIRLYAKNSLTVSSANNTMKQMVFTISKAGKKRLTEITPSVGSCTIDNTNWTVTWVYDAGTQEVTFTVGDKATYGTDGDSKAGQFDIDAVVISSEVGETVVDDDDDDQPTLTTVENIAAFAALAENTEAILKLKNVEVLWASGNDLFVRDNTAAIDFYKTGLSYTVGQVLNGTIIGKYSPYYDVPELAKTDNTNGDNITATSGSDPQPKAIDAAEFTSYLCDLIQVTGTLSIEGSNYYITDEDGNKIQLFDKYSVGNLSAATDGSTYTAVGIATIFKNTNEILLTKALTDEEVKATKAANIAAFKALDQNAVAELTLTNAQVLYNYNNDMFVRDATGALDLYKTGLEFTQNQILNGTITGTNTLYSGLPELKDMTENTLTATDGSAAEPVEVTMATIQNDQYLNDLVQLKSATISVVDSKYYVIDGDTQVQIYDKFKIDSEFEEGQAYDITGILVIFEETWEIYPTEAVLTGIREISTTETAVPVYNLAGQRVQRISKSGIYLKNGHKYLINK